MTSQSQSFDILILIPSYDRPDMLKMALKNWLTADSVAEVFIIAQASGISVFKKYEEVIAHFAGDNRLKWVLYPNGIGSIKARNALLDMCSESRCDYTAMVDDDYVLPEKNTLWEMVQLCKKNSGVGAVGGRVVVKGLRQDGDFFLNLPFNAADTLTRLIGYIFLDVKHGPRFSEFLTPFFIMEKAILEKKLRYDDSFIAPTGFREESDFQMQIKSVGFKLLFDPRRYVIHLGVESGGNRPKMSMGKRVYWKSRNNTLFILKWNSSRVYRVWHISCSSILLILYKPSAIRYILKGITDAFQANRFRSR